MLSPEWADFVGRVEQGAKAMKIHVDRPHATQFARHAKELLEWNRFASLTAITDLKEIAEKHFLDTLPLAPLIPPGSRVLDIGSGGGFPGVPLKVMRPDLHVDLIEASRKKAHFLKHLIRTLALQDIAACHIRAEELAKKTQGQSRRYDVIVSKAVSKVHRFLDQALPLLCKPGMVIAMKGISVKDELERARSRIKSEALSQEKEEYRLPFLGITRHLVILKTT